MSAPIRNVAFCPHCGNTAPQQLVHVQRFWTHGYYPDGTETDPDLSCAYFVATCETCQEVLVYLAEGEIPEPKDFARWAGLIWPDAGFLPQSVPQRVRDCYEEAGRIKRLAPNAFAVQIRRALEAICEDRDAAKGPLHARLKQLATRGEIPPVLAEMTDVLRLLGNIGAHAADQTVKPGHVRVIEEFFRAIVEYVYVGPSKIRAFRETLAKVKDLQSMDEA